MSIDIDRRYVIAQIPGRPVSVVRLRAVGLVAVLTSQGTVTVINPCTSSVAYTLSAETGAQTCMDAFSARGDVLVVGDTIGNLHVWTFRRDGTANHTVMEIHPNPVTSVCCVDYPNVLSVSMDEEARVVDVERSEASVQIELPNCNGTTAVHCGPRTVLICLTDSSLCGSITRVYVWDVVTIPDFSQATVLDGAVRSARFVGKRKVALGFQEGSLAVFNVRDQTYRKMEVGDSDITEITCIGHETIAISGRCEDVALWDTSTLTRVNSIRDITQSPRPIKFDDIDFMSFLTSYDSERECTVLKGLAVSP